MACTVNRTLGIQRDFLSLSISALFFVTDKRTARAHSSDSIHVTTIEDERIVFLKGIKTKISLIWFKIYLTTKVINSIDNEKHMC